MMGRGSTLSNPGGLIWSRASKSALRLYITSVNSGSFISSPTAWPRARTSALVRSAIAASVSCRFVKNWFVRPPTYSPKTGKTSRWSGSFLSRRPFFPSLFYKRGLGGFLPEGRFASVCGRMVRYDCHPSQEGRPDEIEEVGPFVLPGKDLDRLVEPGTKGQGRSPRSFNCLRQLAQTTGPGGADF